MSPEARGAGPRRALVALGLLAVVIFIYAPVLPPSRAFWYRDIYGFWSALADSFVRTVNEGAWPVWNPWLSFGMPMLADPGTQTLYPFTWLNLVLPLTTYYKVYALAHGFGSAAGFYLLARRQALEAPAAFVAALAWVGSGPFQELLGHAHHFGSAAWLPWVILALDLALERRTPRSGVWLGLAAAAQVLAGSGDMCLLTGFIGVAFLAFRVLALEPAVLRRALGIVAFVAAPIAALVAAAQLVPTLDFLRSGMRLAMSAESHTYWSLHPASLLELLAPRILSDLPVSDVVRAALYQGREPLYATLYLGAPLAVVAALGAASGGRLPRLAIGGFVLALLVALGLHTPIYAALAAVTPLSILRYPTKYTVAAAFFAALLVGCGAQAWLARDAPARRRGVRVFGVLLTGLLLGGALLLAVWPDLLGRLLARPEALSSSLGATLSKLVLAGGLAGFATFALGGSRGLRRTALFAAALDLLVVAQSVNGAAPRELIEYRPAAAGLTPGSRVYVPTGSDRAWLPGQLERAPEGWPRAWAIARSRLDLLWPPLGARFGMRGSYDGDFTGLGAPLLSNLTLILSSAEGTPAGLRLLQVAGVDDVLTADDRRWPGLVAEREIPGLLRHPIRVLRVPDTRPSVLIVGKTRVVPDPDSIYTLVAADFDPLRETVLASGPVLAAPEGFDGSVEIVERRPDRLRLRTRSSGPGVVVILEAFQPGWRATLDGAPSELLHADVLFKAVAVPAGSHEVELRYRPRSLALGALLCIAGLGLAGAILART